jgi:hypothetical protein
MDHDPLRISAVAALPGQRLHLTFEDGWQADVNLSGWIENTRLFKPLQDAALFAQAKRGEWGASVVWVDDAIDMGRTICAIWPPSKRAVLGMSA